MYRNKFSGNLLQKNVFLFSVNQTAHCSNSINEPVCSIEKKTYPSMCHLLTSKTKLSYKSMCFTDCRSTSSNFVCGINGITYRSECEAWSGKN